MQNDGHENLTHKKTGKPNQIALFTDDYSMAFMPNKQNLYRLHSVPSVKHPYWD